MDAEQKLQALRNHLETNIERMKKTAEIYSDKTDEDSKHFVNILLHDRAVFQGILGVLLKL